MGRVVRHKGEKGYSEGKKGTEQKDNGQPQGGAG